MHVLAHVTPEILTKKFAVLISEHSVEGVMLRQHLHNFRRSALEEMSFLMGMGSCTFRINFTRNDEELILHVVGFTFDDKEYTLANDVVRNVLK